MTALVDAAQGLLLQAGQAAGLVSGRGVALADFLAHQLQRLFVAVHDLINPVMDLGRGSPAGQDVLGADELSGLGQDGGAALLDDQIAELPDQGIGGKAAGGVRAAALRANDKLGHGEFFLLQQGRFFHHFLGVADGHINSLQGAAGLLDDDLLQGLVGAFLDGLHHQIHLAVFAAQGHHHRAVDVGVGGIAGHDIHGELLVGSHLRAAQLVVEGHAAHHLLRDDAGGIGGADAGRQDQNLVAHANAAVRTLITVEIHIEILLFSALGIQVFPVLFQIVAVDMLAGLDIAGGQADMLTVLDNGLALGNVAGSQLVINGDILQSGQALFLAGAVVSNGVTLGNGLNGNDHVVLRRFNDHSIQHCY